MIEKALQALGEVSGERVRNWLEAKKLGWYVVLEAPQMPAISTPLVQAHNVIN